MGEETADERAVGSRRAAWCIITSVEQKEKTDGKEQQAAYAREYVGKVETELQKIFGNILALMDKIAELSIEIGSEKGGAKTDLKKHAKIMRENLDWDETAELNMNSTGPVEKCLRDGGNGHDDERLGGSTRTSVLQRMIQEEYNKQEIEAKNALKNCCFTARNTREKLNESLKVETRKRWSSVGDF